jgi:glycerophosphoryl diester phosphodiesterase
MKLMGHRGALEEAPENTIKSFQTAVKSNVQAMELDIHLSKDGEIVVIHDPTLERTTNGKGAVKDFTLEELKKLDAGEGEKIPTLKEALDYILPLDIEVQIEIKAQHLEVPLSKFLKDYPAKDLIHVICFNHYIIKAFKEMNPDIRTTCLLYGLPLNPVEIIEACKADGISVNTQLISPQLVEQCHQKNYLVTAWTANDLETYKMMESLNLDYLGTDKPSLFK